VLQPNTGITFLQFLDEWVERYRGQGRGFRENTRDEYRRLIRTQAHRYFSTRLKLVDVTTYDLARFVDWLADPDEQGRRIADSTIANVMMPIRSALATATREGLIRHNPARGLPLPRGEQHTAEDEDGPIKVFSREQLAALLTMAPEPHKLLFEVLACCGLRVSEAIGLQRLHALVDEAPPEICVRRALVKGRIGPPKSSYGRRDVPLAPRLARRLRDHIAGGSDNPTALLFTNEAGGPVDPNNLRRRVLKPLVQEVGAHEHRAAQPRARTSLAGIHAVALHASVAGRGGASARDSISCRRGTRSRSRRYSAGPVLTVYVAWCYRTLGACSPGEAF
jgi:integrase